MELDNNKESLMAGWHLDKRVSVSHIITTGGFMLMAMAAWFTLESRVTLNEHEIIAIKATGVTLANGIQQMEDNILDKLDSIQDKQYEHIREHNQGQ